MTTKPLEQGIHTLEIIKQEEIAASIENAERKNDTLVEAAKYSMRGKVRLTRRGRPRR